MTIDELIARLQELRQEHGNLPVYQDDGYSEYELAAGDVEFRDAEPARTYRRELPGRIAFNG
jgi:hypothetical protein